jgi:hypothetical protein
MTNQEQQPAPSGLGAVLSIVQAVVALVPRWLIVACGAVFLAWLGFDLYLNARQKIAKTEEIEAVSRAKSEPYIGALVNESPPASASSAQPAKRPVAPMIGPDPYRN